MRIPVIALWLGMMLAPRAWPAGQAVVELQARDGPGLRLVVELALAPLEWRQGLMGRRALAPGHGMLFDFGQDDQRVMWMKNTLVPLDMIFVDSTGRVVHVVTRTTPLSETLLPSPVPARYVIEINAGDAAVAGIGPGSRLRLPLNDGKIWP